MIISRNIAFCSTYTKLLTKGRAFILHIIRFRYHLTVSILPPLLVNSSSSFYIFSLFLSIYLSLFLSFSFSPFHLIAPLPPFNLPNLIYYFAFSLLPFCVVFLSLPSYILINTTMEQLRPQLPLLLHILLTMQTLLAQVIKIVEDADREYRCQIHCD